METDMDKILNLPADPRGMRVKFNPPPFAFDAKKPEDFPNLPRHEAEMAAAASNGGDHYFVQQPQPDQQASTPAASPPSYEQSLKAALDKLNGGL